MPSRNRLVCVHVCWTTMCRLPSDVLIVSLLDGHVVALDQGTGRVVWTFDSGAPLVSARQSLTSSQGLNVFPGTDGGLYAYHGLTHLNPGLEVGARASSCAGGVLLRVLPLPAREDAVMTPRGL